MHGSAEPKGFQDTEKKLHLAKLLGVVQRHQGELHEAHCQQLTVLAGRDSVVGEDDPETIDTVQDLADVYERLSEFDNAQTFDGASIDGSEGTIW